MPTYQYACTVDQCGHQFDTVQAFSDDALTDCPECTGRLRKVWGSIGVVFKGSGFYRNDSREAAKSSRDKEDKQSSRKKEGNESSSSSDSGSKSTDKPAATSTEKSTTKAAPAKAAGSTSATSSAPAAS